MTRMATNCWCAESIAQLTAATAPKAYYQASEEIETIPYFITSLCTSLLILYYLQQNDLSFSWYNLLERIIKEKNMLQQQWLFSMGTKSSKQQALFPSEIRWKLLQFCGKLVFVCLSLHNLQTTTFSLPRAKPTYTLKAQSIFIRNDLNSLRQFHHSTRDWNFLRKEDNLDFFTT